MCTLFGGILGHHKNWPKGSYARPEQMRDDDTDFSEPSVFFNFLCMDISPIYWRMTSLGNGRINSPDVSSKNTSCFSFIQTLKFRMLELYCSRVLGTNRSSLISAAIVVPSWRSVLLEVDDDIILLRICLYYVFNDCTKTSSMRVAGRIQLQSGVFDTRKRELRVLMRFSWEISVEPKTRVALFCY